MGPGAERADCGRLSCRRDRKVETERSRRASVKEVSFFRVALKSDRSSESRTALAAKLRRAQDPFVISSSMAEEGP
jgi:hypothetical protein